MKRNLNAIIALVLVVVMVFPMSIFVGAADALTAKQGDTNFTAGATLEVPTGSSKALTFTVPTGYSNLKAAKETDNAASTVKVSNNTVTFTGAMVGKTDTYKVTATKGSGSTLSTLSFSVKVKAVDIATEGDITVSCTKTSYAPGAEISKADFKVEGKLNTGDAITYTIEGIKIAGEEYTDTVIGKGGDTAISVKYKITNAGVKDPDRTADGVAIVVLGQKLTITSVVLNDPQPYIKTESITPATLKNFLKVTVSEAGSTSTVSGFDVKLMKGTQEINNITYAQALLGGYSLKVIYKGEEKVQNLFTASELYDTTVPNAVEYNGTKKLTSKTEFFVGEKIEEITKTNAKNYFNILYIAAKDPDADSSATDADMTADADVTISSISFSALETVDKPITVTMVVNGKTLTCEVTPKQLGVTKIKERAITGIQLSSTKSTMKTTYAEGDVLDLNGLWIDLVYDYGDPKPVQYGRDFTCDPGAGTVLNKSIKSLRVNYTDPDTEEIFTCTIPLTITAAERKVKEVQVVNASAIKNEYYIGEALDVNGLVLMVMYTDNFYEYKTLTSSTKPTVISASYQNGKFTAAYSGSLEISLDITYNKADSTATKTETVTVTIPSVTVTKRPTLVSITATSDKKEYLEGESPKICDFRITAKYDNGDTRDFEVAENNANAAKTTASFTSGNVTYTIKLTPTVISDTTDYVRVSFTEKVVATSTTTTTKTYDFEIDVIIPDAILSYYDTSLSKTVQASYEDLYDALEEAQERYDSRYPSRVPKIILCRDVAMISDFDTIVPMDIDLNGHTLTMIRGELYVYSGAGATVEVDFFNTAKADAKLVYSDDDEDTVIIAYNDSYVIDRDTDSDGKYDVSITTPKNGKVTGPKEVTHGHDAVFTLTPDDGYSISSIKVNSKTMTIPSDGKLVISNVQEKLTITVTFVEMEWDNPFTDVYKSAAFYKSVQFVYEKELFQGMSANKFEPNTTMTRAMFVTVLGRLAGIDADTAAARYGYSSTFTDVSSTDQSIRYAVPYIKWATDNGLIEGYGDGKFGPKDDITHAQMYVLMQRYALLIEQQNTNAAGTAISAKDLSSIPDWAYSAVEYASKKNFLIMSSTKHLTPNGDATRAELAQLLEKFCTNVLGE